MEVVRFSTIDQLIPLAADWDRLARGVPFRSWHWLSTWWQHYCQDPQEPQPRTSLFTLGVFDRVGALVGVAPWYVEHSRTKGRVVRFLGSGEVCSDYMSVLCEPELADRVTELVAEWLVQVDAPKTGRPVNRESDAWDLLELTGVDAEDDTIGRLAEHLAARTNTVHRRPGPNCWRIDLPGDWEQFLATVSKDHRKKLRRTERQMVTSGRAVLHTVRCMEDLSQAREILIDLHQRRRRQLGEPGRFTLSRFDRFHREVMSKLLLAGQLHLHWIELDGRPVAAEYHFSGGPVMYAYQAGIEPDALDQSPGRLASVLTLRYAIDQGFRQFDFLRGNEPYKAHWCARPRGTMEFRIIAARRSAQLRHGIWLAGSNVKRWVRKLVESEEWRVKSNK